MGIEETLTDLASAHVPEILLLVAGFLSLFIVYEYRKNELSKTYKFAMFLGLVAGVAIILCSLSAYTAWPLSTAILVAVTGFALIIRPFREIQIALIVSIFIMVVVYILLGGLAGGDFDALASGWPRIIAAFVLGALVYLLTHFLESIILLFGKLLNWWPFLAILSVLCIIEAVLILSGNGTLGDIYEANA